MGGFFQRRSRPTTGRIRLWNGGFFDYCLWWSVSWLVGCALLYGLAHRYAVRVTWPAAIGVWLAGVALLGVIVETIMSRRQVRRVVFQKIIHALLLCLLLSGLCGSPVAGVVYFLAR